MRNRIEPPQPAPAQVQPPFQNVLAPAGFGGINPGLSLSLGRIGFDTKPQPALATLEAPPRKDPATEQALKRRDWILDVQTRQRALSPRTGGIERVRGLMGEAFLDHFYALSRPVVLEGALESWPAVAKWTPGYMAEKVGSAEIEYQGGRTSNPDFEMTKDRHKQKMPFDRFIAEIEQSGYGNDLYITAYNSATNRAALAPLEADLSYLDAYLTREHGMMWIGPMGTFTPLHFDLTNNLIAQVRGSKRLVLLPPSETQRLYNHKHVFSAVHDITDEERLSRFPLARDAQVFEVDLEPGDAIFVPIGWWHQVTSLDFSVTLTYTNFRWPNQGHESFPAD